YIPSFVASRGFVPTLLILSALKFTIVVMFYMHLKYDHRLFRVLFTGPLLIAGLTLLALMFLFGHLYLNVLQLCWRWRFCIPSPICARGDGRFIQVRSSASPRLALSMPGRRPGSGGSRPLCSKSIS